MSRVLWARSRAAPLPPSYTITRDTTVVSPVVPRVLKLGSLFGLVKPLKRKLQHVSIRQCRDGARPQFGPCLGEAGIDHGGAQPQQLQRLSRTGCPQRLLDLLAADHLDEVAGKSRSE